MLKTMGRTLSCESRAQVTTQLARAMGMNEFHQRASEDSETSAVLPVPSHSQKQKKTEHCLGRKADSMLHFDNVPKFRNGLNLKKKKKRDQYPQILTLVQI